MLIVFVDFMGAIIRFAMKGVLSFKKDESGYYKSGLNLNIDSENMGI